MMEPTPRPGAKYVVREKVVPVQSIAPLALGSGRNRFPGIH